MKKKLKICPQKFINDQSGVALIVALGAMSIMLIVGTVVVSISMNRDKTVAHDRQLTEAESVAEAGIDEAIQVTLSNYLSVYSTGIPPSSTPGDGVQLFNNAPLRNGNNVIIGTYSVWTKADPDRPGNVLITAKGKDDASQAFTSTVRVSVKYAPGFDYVLFDGKPSQLATATFTAGDRSGSWSHSWGSNCSSWGWDSSNGCGNIVVTGKVNVNGNMSVQADLPYDGGWHDHDWHHHHDGDYGSVTFTDGSGTVNYTNTFSGDLPTGTQPSRGSTVVFPTVNLGAFTSSVTTVNFPSSGAPTGWTYHSSSWNSPAYYDISAANFQSRYGAYQVVKLTTSRNGIVVKINGACGAAPITSTILMPGASGSGAAIAELDLVGPNIDLEPVNGLAILSGEGKVSFKTSVGVGYEGHGALIYLSGENGTSSFETTGNMVLYGSLIVNGAVNLTASGQGEWRHHSGHHSHYQCGDSWDHNYHDSNDQYNDHSGADRTINVDLNYDAAWLTNSNLPAGWWSWNGSSSYTAIKDNFSRS